MKRAFARLIAVARIKAGRLVRDHLHFVVRGAEGRGAFAIVGSPHVRHHFGRVYLGAREGNRVLGGLRARDCTGLARRLARSHGFAVLSEIEIPPALAPDLLRVPRFVALTVELGASQDEFFARLPFAARDAVRRARIRGFRHEVSRDSAWAGEFHARFHEPSVRGRHGDEGYVMPVREIAASIRDEGAEFLRLFVGDQCVAALTAYREGDTYRMGRGGWLEGDPAWVKAGVVGARYWFAILRARELGCTRVNLGGTPPYLDDGLFQFKVKWNASLDATATVWGDHHLLLAPEHPGVRRMLSEHALLAWGAGNEPVVFSARRPADVHLTAHIARGIGHWFRLLDEPDPSRAGANPGVPANLRPWFVEEPMNRIE